jgi:hypothetical protein
MREVFSLLEKRKEKKMMCISLSRKLRVKIGEAYFIIYTWFMESKASMKITTGEIYSCPSLNNPFLL